MTFETMCRLGYNFNLTPDECEDISRAVVALDKLQKSNKENEAENILHAMEIYAAGMRAEARRAAAGTR